MTFFARVRLFLSCILLSLLIASFGQVPKKDLLPGRWIFEKFELADFGKQEIKEANLANRGLV